MTIRVLLADDDALLRAGVAVVLGTAEDIDVVGQAADGLHAVELCRSLSPDVVLMDVRYRSPLGVASRLWSPRLASAAGREDERTWGSWRLC